MSNQQLPDKLNKPLNRKFKKWKVYSSFKDKIVGANLGEIQSLRKFDKGFRYLLCGIDVYSKYAEVVSLKDKKGIKITIGFQEILDEAGRKPSKIRLNKGRKV